MGESTVQPQVETPQRLNYSPPVGGDARTARWTRMQGLGDLTAIEELEAALKGFDAALIAVSHGMRLSSAMTPGRIEIGKRAPTGTMGHLRTGKVEVVYRTHARRKAAAHSAKPESPTFTDFGRAELTL